MQNDRNDKDDKYQGSDDSEYHFSGDDMQYEADPETAQKETSEEAHPGGSVVETVSNSKRMIISLVVFIVLVGVVYKMVAPSSSTPGTDITPAPVVASNNAASANAVQQPAAPVVAAPQPPAQVAMQQPQAPQPASVMQATEPMQQAQAMQPGMQPGLSAPQVQPPQQPPQVPVALSAEAQTAQPMQQPSAVPGVMSAMQPPVNQPATTNNNSLPDMAFGASIPTGNVQGMDAQSAALAAENAKLYSQLQAEYAKRLNDFQNENKNLQNQVQVLNTRVATMETEMTQLVQTLSQQFQGNGASSSQAPAQAMPEQAAPPPRIPYNVQAIIPGRAWLRSNNGDTLTVAEGDEIKGIGRVSKIDPYDGVVEINVHGKIVSLSYGNGS